WPTPASTTSPTKIEWSPFSTLATRRHSTKAGVLVRIGAPVAPARNGSPEIVEPWRSAGLKNVKAIACCPLPRTFRAKALDSLMTWWAWESAVTPTATRGGANDAWVTQFTVAAAVPDALSAVRTYRP